MHAHTCPKCSEEMTKGFIGDRSNLDTEVRPVWGTAISAIGTGMDNAFPVTTYRCPSCGYLESFAL